jgi:predicted nuclease of restriction endonuclease-like (RecB) superfamily
MEGLSRRNLYYARQLAACWPLEVVQQAVAQLPWGHNTVLLDKAASPGERDWYAREAAAHGWSRAVLLNQIKTQTHRRVV